MNLASWLTRSGLSHPHMPAAALGSRVVMTYGQLATRAAKLAGAPPWTWWALLLACYAAGGSEPTLS